jgi:hypothetical protein
MKKRVSSNDKGTGNPAWWSSLFSELRTEILSGKHDSLLKGESNGGAGERPDPSERVYPENNAGRAEEARDRQAKQAQSRSSVQERADKTLPDSKVKELVGLCANIRPFVRAEDINALAGISGGLLSAERLSGANQWASGQMPCLIHIAKEGDTAGIVRCVTFAARHHDPEGVAIYGSADALLNSVPRARRVYQTLLAAKVGIELVDLPTQLPGIVARIQFRSDTFEKTTYESAARLKIFDDCDEMREKEEWEEERARQKRKEAYDSLSLGEKLTRFRVPLKEREASLGIDGCLREWASRHSSWGESPNRWESFANWLITESTPDDRHYLAAMNWDHGLHVFHWIIRQPDTDIATVAFIIWQGQGSSYVAETAKSSTVFNLEGYDLLVEIAGRIRSNFYKPLPGHKPIGFEPPYKMGLDLDDKAVRAAADLLMPSVVRGSIAGRPKSELELKMPERYWDLLN